MSLMFLGSTCWTSKCRQSPSLGNPTLPWHGALGRRAAARCKLNVAVQGILDSYRRDMGLVVDPVPAQEPRTASTATATVVPPAVVAHPAARLLEVSPEEGLTWLEDDTPCPVDCVLEVDTPQELQDVLSSVPPTTVVVADFYKTACGACRYIAPGFVRLCKASAAVGEEEDQQQPASRDQQEAAAEASSTSSSAGSGVGPAVVFVKHNVYHDEEEEVTALARQLNIRSVPMFKFWKGGVEVESFATRDKGRLMEAITRHAGPGVFEEAAQGS